MLEAVDPNGPVRRASAGLAAGREVQASANGLDRSTVLLLLERLEQLKRELQGVIAAGGTDFRTFTAQRLIQEVERLIADATRDVQNVARGQYQTAAQLGASAVDEPIRAARIGLDAAPRIDTELVTAAYDLTGDLLTIPMQQFRNTVVQGIRRAATIGDGSPYVELAKNIGAAGFDEAAFKAERIVRTEMSRVLNTATFARLQGLAAQMPFLRKGWRSAKDSRVRLGHREAGQKYARGQGIPITQPFQVNVYAEPKMVGRGASAGVMATGGPKLLGTALLRFPSDPEATPAGRIAAGATIMCRCNAFVDFDLADLRAWSTSRSQGLKIDKGELPPEEKTPIPKAPRKPRASKAAKPLETAEQLHAKVLATDKAFEERRGLLHNFKIVHGEIAVRAARRNAAALESVGGEKYTAALLKMDEALEALTKLRQELSGLEAARLAALRKALEVPASMRTKVPVRFAGGKDGQAFGGPDGGADVVRARYLAAAKDLERLVGFGAFTKTKLHDWQSGPQYRTVTIGRAKDLTNPKQFGHRAYASEFQGVQGKANSINMGSNDAARVVVHELGHILEFNSPEVKAAALEFLKARTRGEQLRRLRDITGSTTYRDHEVARPDKFLSPYMGKDYGGQYTEIVSMGLEHLYADPVGFARADPDYFKFMVDLLRGRFRSGGGG